MPATWLPTPEIRADDGFKPSAAGSEHFRDMAVKGAFARVIAALLLGGTACASPRPLEGPAPPPEAFAIADCPVRNVDFCKVAVQVTNAIVSKDAETIIQNGRLDRFDAMTASPQLIRAVRRRTCWKAIPSSPSMAVR